MRILMAQITIPNMHTAAQQSQHITALVAHLDQLLVQQKVDLVLLPELSNMHYSEQNFANIKAFAEPLDGPICQAFRVLCQRHKVAVCFGLARVEGDKYFISQVVLDRQGTLLCHYDKVHTAAYGDSSEKRYFSRGDHLACFQLDGVRFGLAICYDLRFADLFQRYRQACDVDVMLHPVAFARDMTFATWHPFVITRALENQVFFLSLNRAGSYFGQSIACPPWVDDEHQPQVLGDEEAFLVVDVDRLELQRVRQTIPYARDALADYQSLQ